MFTKAKFANAQDLVGKILGPSCLVLPLALILSSERAEAQDNLPSKLVVPPGYHLLLKAKAAGVQIYSSVADEQGRLKWALEAPLATLHGQDQHTRARIHYAGPTWEASATKVGSTYTTSYAFYEPD